MIDNNTLIKIVRSLKIIDWPDQVNYMRLHLKSLLRGFPGIGLGHLTLIKYKDLLKNDIFIYDPAIMYECPNPTTPPIMIKNSKVVGIGEGPFTGIHVDDDITNLTIDPDSLILRVDCRPKPTGGAGYFYFYKSKRNYQKEGLE